MEDRDEAGRIIGVLCKLCHKHGRQQHNRAGTWTDKPCTCIRKDMLKRHSESVMHRDAEDLELSLSQSHRDGGIRMAFEKGIAGCPESCHSGCYEVGLLVMQRGCSYLQI